MKAKLVGDALLMAIWQYKPKTGLIHHSDNKKIDFQLTIKRDKAAAECFFDIVAS